MRRLGLLFGGLCGGALLLVAVFWGMKDGADDEKLSDEGEGIVQAPAGSVRMISRKIPAPRGPITDRKGQVMARNRVAYYFALQFPQFSEEVSEGEILRWSGDRLGQVSELEGKEVKVSDERLLSHYQERRWVPLLLPGVVEEEQREQWEPQLMRGLSFQAIYLREYPGKARAAHVIGYVRSKGRLPQGPIGDDELMWEDTYGEEGLENTLESELAGEAGQLTLWLDESGERLQEEVTLAPITGNTVVTTLDLIWQEHAEAVLADSCERGAIVVIDTKTGEVLVLASQPSYDLNLWIPRITQEGFTKLREDKTSPMFARAFQGSYPPAATFKPIVALAGLKSGDLTEETVFDCPPYITIGSQKFHNRNGVDAGRLDVKKALAMSNSVWFFQARAQVDYEEIKSLAQAVGLGEKTGLCLYNEAPGKVPTNEFMILKEGRPMTVSDTSSTVIGQGYLSGTPLQVAQMMAGVGDGQFLPQLSLVREVQDHEGKVLWKTVSAKRKALDLSPSAVRIVHEGMKQVVHSEVGTGKNGGTDFCKVAGKVGTAQ